MSKVKIWLTGVNTLTNQGLAQILNTNGYEAHTRSVNEVLNIDWSANNYPNIIIWEEQILKSKSKTIPKIFEFTAGKVKSVFLLNRSSMHFLGIGLSNGIQGYVHMKGGISELELCIKNVLNGSIFISPLLAGEQDFNKKKRKRYEKVESLLTKQEKKILKYVGKKRTSKQIASILNISYKTVQNHRQNICRKLGLRGRNKLLEFAKLMLADPY